MRFRELLLAAYGPFTSVTLDFSKPGLHVLFGRNEAGKSTALRAVGGLLFGIEKNTPDAHLHAMRDLRIGATLEGEHGELLRIVRRKGNANTLLDQADHPMDDAALRRMLGGVTAEMFRSMFGLDHETLRQGAQALLLGRGDVGESLFGASIGGEIHEVLRGLTAEADALFAGAANATRPPLNAALRAFAEAQKRVRALSESQALVTQQAGLDDAIAERDKCVDEKRALLLEQSRIRRAQRIRPLAAKRVTLTARRLALGSVPELPESATRDREDAERGSRDAKANAERLEAEIAELLVPSARSELKDLEDEARRILARVRPDVAFEAVESLRTESARQARIKKLSLAAARLEEKEAQATRAASAKRAALDECRDEGGPSPRTEAASALRREVTRAQQRGDLEEALRRGELEVARLDGVARARVRALGLTGDAIELEATRSLAVPTIETIDRAAQRWQSLERDEASCREKCEVLAQRAAQLERDIDAAERGGEVPTEERLAAARARRRKGWVRVVAAWELGDPPSASDPEVDPARTLANAFDHLVEEADAIADGLRRDAERIARIAGLHAQADAGAKERERLGAEGDALTKLHEELRAEWRASWSRVPMEPRPPAEMRGWIGRHASAVEAIEQLRAAELSARALRAQIAEIEAALRSALTQAGETAREADGLSLLLARAIERARAIEDDGRAANEREQRAKVLTREIAEAEAEATMHAAALASWREAWAREVGAIGLAQDVSPEHATSVLDDLAELFRCVDDAAKTKARVTSVLREKREALGAETAKTNAAKARLDALLKRASATDLAELEAAERHAAEARDLDAQLLAVDEQLGEIGSEGDVAALAALDADALEAQSEEIVQKLDEVERRHHTALRNIGALEQGFKEIRNESAAAIAAAEAQESLARVRTHAERYIRVRLAATVLSREIERYRERNQGPIVQRASALFARMTLGAYAGLRVGYDETDKPALRCVRAPAQQDAGAAHEVDVEGLSDGTRDQLYLSLRLATIERYAQTNAPMPLVVDDILVHFDDDRARAALEALGEVSARTQVLLFTHHARVVELAREATHGAAHVHTLETARASTSALTA